ncbi:response regulator transcription factor [Paenibacillus sp. alder61]|uniref:Response regulator transcription factor n=1 Tax=Paenibacillus faecis TaxID=862114 RepID=A0A5D0CZJ4_9BACL|nr:MULTISPECIES: response regulator transcription factor [Paenibacillus]MCA1293842.1 response regulator transcription factor [Paenibacillus sp. alder61]TYA15421.1 response regulator transcription factor [Paenibacillus faecis]
MSKTILLADDDPDIVALLKLFLEKEDLVVIEAYNGAQAWTCIRERRIDLAVIDIMMPGLDGIQLLKQLRTNYKMPVIMISAKSQDSDKILGLQLGADDFLAKPFNPLEAVARVQAMLRRTYEFNEPPAEPPIEEIGSESVTIGELRLCSRNCALYKQGEEIPLTAIEYKLLKAFMDAPGRVFTKKQLFEQAWSDYYYEDANTIMVHISRLRDKIEDNPRQPAYIRTIRGLGYKFARKEDFS